MKQSEAPQPGAGKEDEPVATQAGEVQTRSVPNPDGKGATTYISSPRMGTVRETELPHQVTRWESPGITFAGLADLLDRVAPLSLPIVDQTGKPGRYAVTFEASLREAIGLGNPSELDAVVVRAFNDGLRKLGLQLDRRKGEVEMVMVDRARQTPSEN